MSRLRFFFAAIALCLGLFCTVPAHAGTNILFIVDASGSMKKQVDSQQRMDVAKKVLGEALAGMPKDAQLGLMVYGHRKAKDCSDIELVDPIGSEEASAISKTVTGLTPKGETPIADSLRKAAKSFKAFKGQQNSIILVTDGVEECKGDPCAAAKELKDAGLDVAVNIVGFTLGEAEGKALQCVTEITGGKYYSASNAAGLTDALKQVQKQVEETVVVQTAKAPENDGNLISPKNGGKLVYAPSEKWNSIGAEPEDFSKIGGATYDGEGVWSFKDGKPATFARVEVLIPQTYEYNLKDFEILAGDSAAGPFRSLGAFTALNVKVQPKGWQAFTFPETTAKFVKIVYKNGYGGHIQGSPMRVVGKIDETAPAEEKKAETGTDILAAKNGGTLVSAPNNNWATMNTKELKTATYGGEGIWSFKDGKPATFHSIGLLLPDTSPYNLKDFEVFAGDDAAGPFKSLGEFTTVNVKMMPDGWQDFAFPETKARFVKVAFKTQHSDSYIRGHLMRLMGTVDESAPVAEKAAEVKGENILAQANGGNLLISPNDDWTKLNDGKTDRGATPRESEGVWSFKDEKPAIIEAVDVLIPAAEDYNLKDFEVLVGDDGPTGQFKSIGTFTTQNVKVMPDGYQRFTFPKVQAKYIKFSLKKAQGDSYISLYEFRVWGNPAS